MARALEANVPLLVVAVLPVRSVSSSKVSSYRWLRVYWSEMASLLDWVDETL